MFSPLSLSLLCAHSSHISSQYPPMPMVQSLVRALGWLLLGLLAGCTVSVRARADVEAELQPAWPQPVFNVLKFGATGDGLTKDTLAIQAALKVFICWLSIVLQFSYTLSSYFFFYIRL